MSLPVAIAQQCDFAMTGPDILLDGGPSKDGLNAENVEGIRRNVIAAHALRFAASDKNDIANGGSGYAAEDGSVACDFI